MTTMSIRGIDEQSLAHLKDLAKQEGSSLNSLVLRILKSTDPTVQGVVPRKFDDLDALAGTWAPDEAEAFERHTAAFAEVDPALWG